MASLAALGAQRPRVPRSTWLAPGAQVVGDVRLGEEACGGHPIETSFLWGLGRPFYLLCLNIFSQLKP